MRKIESISIHCSGTSTGSAIAFDSYHRSKGWDCIGYHFVINNGKTSDGKISSIDGSVEVGRKITKKPAAVRGHNKGSIAICVVGSEFGDFTLRQKKSLVELIIELKNKYNIKYENIKGHREYKNVHKNCPCMNIHDVVSNIEKGFSASQIALKIKDDY